MYRNYIHGKLVEGRGAQYQVKNPATDELLLTINGIDIAQAQEALESANEAFKTWSGTTITERVDWMMKLKAAYIDRINDFVDILANETGKAYNEARAECKEFVESMDFFSEEIKRVYGTSITDYKRKRAEVLHLMEMRPIGVHVSHLTWNFPVQAIGHKLAPTLASGCTCVLKPSIYTPMTALALAQVIDSIGFPKGVINIVTGDSSIVGKALNESLIPRLISVIGASSTGRTIMRQASTSIKHFSFELGGNAPAVIMPDADLDKAVKFITARKVRGCGQGCSSVNRVFVHEAVSQEFVGLLVEEFKKVHVGWGRDDPGAMGSQINQKSRDLLLELIDESVSLGAELLYGGKVPDDLPPHLSNGAFIMPTLLVKVTDDMPICNRELFGPVLPVLTFSDLDDVIKRANSTNYGLASYLFTHDSRVIAKALDELEFGEVYVNSIERGIFLPHVGIKESGIGCTSSKWSLEEYFHLKRFSIVP